MAFFQHQGDSGGTLDIDPSFTVSSFGASYQSVAWVDNDCTNGADDGLTFVDYWPDRAAIVKICLFSTAYGVSAGSTEIKCYSTQRFTTDFRKS